MANECLCLCLIAMANEWMLCLNAMANECYV